MPKIWEFKKVDLAPIKSFHIQDQLNPKVWDKQKIKRKIRTDLLQIAIDFWDSLDLNTEVIDVILTGSLANYNWSEKYSDFDLHILIDFTKVDDNIDLVKKYLDEAKKNWNLLHDITIQGFEVEVYVQDINEPHTSSGVFSLLHNQWKVVPTKSNFQPNEKQIRDKAEAIMVLVDDIEDNFNILSYEEAQIRLKKVWEKVKDLRKSGLEEGEFGLGNLVFKVLRRNNYIEKIIQLKRKSYDQNFK